MVEFSDNPSVLVVADGEAAVARARRSAELAGCRVSAVATVAGGLERLSRQAGLDAVLLELDRDSGAPLDRLLEGIEEAARQGRYGSVISAPAPLIDVVAARTWHPRVLHLCEADEADRVAAIALASARQKHRLHDIGKEQGAPRLQQLSDEVGRIATALASLSFDAGTEKVAEGEPEEILEGRFDAGQIRAMIRARRMRAQYLGSDLFADPAWDILLDLFAARLERRRVAVSSLCIAAGVPPTTALRWIKTLTDVGLLVRVADPQDGRRVHIELAPGTAGRLESYLIEAQRVSPLAV